MLRNLNKSIVVLAIALLSIAWTNIDENCALFGYHSTVHTRHYTEDCSPNPYRLGLTDDVTVWFNCREPDDDVWGRAFRWSKCLNEVEHYSHGNAYHISSYGCLWTDDACIIQDEGLADAVLRVDPESPEGMLLRAIISRAENVRDQIIDEGGPDLEHRLMLVDASDLFIELADAGFYFGDLEEATQSVSIAQRILDVATDFTPGVSFVKDAIILVTGENPITGETVSDAERALTLAALVVPSFISGGASAIVKVVDHLDEVADAATPIGRLAGDLVEVVQRADIDLLENVITTIPCSPSLSAMFAETVIFPAAGTPCKTGEVVAAVAEAAAENLDFLRTGSTGFGTAVRIDYAKTYRDHYPQFIDAIGQIHHAVEQGVLTKYPGVVSLEEMHSLVNLRGIPKGEVGSRLHQSQIRLAWDGFYQKMTSEGRFPTKQELLDFARKIDDDFGDLFVPRIR